MTQYANVGTRVHYFEPPRRLIPRNIPDVALCGTVASKKVAEMVDQNAEWPTCRQCAAIEIARLEEEARQALDEADRQIAEMTAGGL